jgi:hypothetical protein
VSREEELRAERDRQLMELIDAVQVALRHLIRELRKEVGGRAPSG